MSASANWRSKRKPLQERSALDRMTENSPMHKVESAALAFRFISAHQNLALDFAANEKYKVRAKKAQTPHPEEIL
jgi:hypothetical protein